VDQPTVLMISDDPDFSRAIINRWQSEHAVPAFTLMSSDICRGFDPEGFHFAIAGRLRSGVLSVLLEAMQAAGKRVLFVSEDPKTLQTVRNRWPGFVVLKQAENWPDTVVFVATEALHRSIAEARARQTERDKALLERQATLGRYMLEMRHNLNNALTSLLGNAELLLLEPGSLSAGSLAQIQTIRNMSLRMHEILQRFSSLEKELSVGERPTDGEAIHSLAAAAR
jgi:signal transduction histidine kinase